MGKKIVAEYDYVDERGELLFQVVRFEPKEFMQRRPDGKGGWVWGLGEAGTVRRVLYRLPELLESSTRQVLIVEGEKAADRMRAEGFLATCSPLGAGKWNAEHPYGESLRGRHVVIIGDNDPPNAKTGSKPGQEHALATAEALKGVTASIKLLPALLTKAPKGGADDWLDEGHTADELKELIRNTAYWWPPELNQQDPPADELTLAMREVASKIAAKAEKLEPEDWVLVARALIADFDAKRQAA